MNKTKSAGFGLIGLVFVMIILGIGLSTLSFLLPDMEAVSREATDAALKADKQALIGYAIVQKKLPDSSGYLNVLPQQQDGYKNTILYAYDSRLTTASAICATPSTYITIGTVTNVAFVIWSIGRDGAVNGGTTNPDKTAGVKSAATTIPYTTPSSTMDDMLEWVTLDELRKNVGCEELKGSSNLNFIVDGLTAGRVGEQYSSIVNFTAKNGSESTYQWCVESSEIASGALSDNFIFSLTTPIVADGGCSGLNLSTAGSPLVLSGNAVFNYLDIGTHSFRVFLQDSIANKTNRLFNLIVKGIYLFKSYSTEFLTGKTSTSGDEIERANSSSNIDLSWSVNSRFTNNNNGSFTDSLTGLTWLENANCFANDYKWDDALTRITTFNSGTNCSAAPTYSGSCTWRMPNITELRSLLDLGSYNPALPNSNVFTVGSATGFSGNPTGEYWTSTSGATSNPNNNAWVVDMTDGTVIQGNKNNKKFVWPVCGG
ncbi:MAG: DUF1566 domain-containing protein [Magnetococcales bacterium]|nr:DUF1566 domain-containing protein [Magnetococcales bacterium]